MNDRLKKAKDSTPHLNHPPKRRSIPLHKMKEHAKTIGRQKVKEMKNQDQAKEALVKALGITHFDGSLQDLLVVVKKKQAIEKKKKRAQDLSAARRRRKEERRIDPNDGR